jgi:hypothetical protein
MCTKHALNLSILLYFDFWDTLLLDLNHILIYVLDLIQHLRVAFLMYIILGL